VDGKLYVFPRGHGMDHAFANVSLKKLPAIFVGKTTEVSSYYLV
jgi:hypothetical protein